MKINEKLFLVSEHERSDGVAIFVHSAPLSRAVFEANYLLLTKTFAGIHRHNLAYVSGPRVSALMLRDMGKELKIPDGPDPADAMLAEIKRLTNVLSPGPSGWETIPYDDALKMGAMGEEEAAEVLNGIVFFTAGYHNYPRVAREEMLRGAADIWGWQLTSLTCTEYVASLQTSTKAEVTGETKPVTEATIQGPDGQARPLSVPS